MKKINSLIAFLLLMACSCRPAGDWGDGLAGYKETHSRDLSVEILRMAGGDTAAVNYRIRLRPSAKNNAFVGQQEHLNYGMDSCFYLVSGAGKVSPSFVQAVPDGIKECYEYLVSFNISEAQKLKPLSLVYDDRLTGLKRFSLSLNKQKKI